MQDVGRAACVRKWNGHDGHAQRREQPRELVDTGLVGPKTPADRERVRIHPDHISGFCRSIAADLTQNRNAPLFEGIGKRRPFTAARHFPGLQNYRALIRYQYRIVRIDRIEIGAWILGKVYDRRAGFRE